jgi:spore coat protein U-like protein
MNWINRIGRLVGLVAILVLAAIPAQAQAPALTATAAPVNLSLSIGESLTISASPSSIAFGSYNSSLGTATASGPITVQTNWNLAAGHSDIYVLGWLGSASAALSGPQNIPSSDIFSSTNGATAVPCTDSFNLSAPGYVSGAGCPNGGGGHYLGATALSGPSNSSQTDTIVLSLSGATNLSAGSYSGTITFQADVF